MRRALVGAVAALLWLPSGAAAHGLVGRADLPLPDWLFTWGATVVLVVSFVGLAVLWRAPRLQTPTVRPLPRLLARACDARATEVACGLAGTGLLALTLYAGYAGSPEIDENFAPTFVYVGFWLGLVPLSMLFGDVFRAFNPWRAIGRAFGATVGRRMGNTDALEYPRRLGYWPAVAGLLAFGWLELVALSGDEPRSIAVAATIYTAITLIGQALFGVEVWTRRGEAFSVYFSLLARMSPIERRNGTLGVRAPLSGLPSWEAHPGAVALLATMIGIVSFDGLSAGAPWNDLALELTGWLRDSLGVGPPDATRITFTLSLVVVVGLCALLYRLGIEGVRGVDRRRNAAELSRAFVHTLVPIAFAYVAAHYVSLLLLQGQALAPLVSDPLGDGANVIGTAAWTVDYRWIGAELFWYLQVGFVVLGHVAGLTLAHDRALSMYGDTKKAARSQYWLLAVMVCFTTLALWLLAQARIN